MNIPPSLMLVHHKLYLPAKSLLVSLVMLPNLKSSALLLGRCRRLLFCHLALIQLFLLGLASASQTAAPVVNTEGTWTATKDVFFHYQIFAANAPTSYSATGLPAGLTLDPKTGLISGNPTISGTYTLSLAATNASGTGTVPLVLNVTGDLAKGADVGWLQQMDATGFQFYENNGQQLDPDQTINCLKILRARNIDTIRLRVFVPPQPAGWNNIINGNCNIPEVVAVAAKAKALGFRLSIDLEFSWSFAQPGGQSIPIDWVNAANAAAANPPAGVTAQQAAFQVLVTEVTNHVTDALTQLKAAGVTPEWVQIGNEITGGILLQNNNAWPAAGTNVSYGGSTSNWPQLTQILNAGYAAVKAADPNIKVVIHIDRAHSDSLNKGFYTNLKNYGGHWDISGTDCFSGTLSDIAYTMNDLATSFNQPGQGGDGVMMCEIEPPGVFDSNGNYAPYPNFDWVTGVLNLMRAIPGGKGVGALYWEPEADHDWDAGWPQSAWVNHEPCSALDSMRPSILHTDGLNIAGGGEQRIQLKGVNLGGCLLMEPWMTPADSSGLVDEYSIIQKLDSRFGVPTEQSLISTYRKSWIAAQDFDNIKAQGLNVVRVPVWWGDFYPLSTLDTKTVAITGPTSASGSIGAPFSYAVTATNFPTSFTASPLPAGLTFNTVTGVLSGTPTATGTTSVALQATGAGGTGTQTLSVAVGTPASGAPVVTSAASVSVSSTSPSLNYTITATNTPTSFSTSTLPAGLSLNTTTGLINGTLNPSTPGVYEITLTAKNATGSSSTNLALTVTGTVSAGAAPVLRADAFTVLDSLVQTAAERGIYTVIDMHGVFGGQSTSFDTGQANQNQYWTSTSNQANTQAMWSAIAAHYRGNAWVAGYDLLNEPSGAPSNQAVVTQLNSLYTAVRAVDPSHIIFLEGTFGNPWGWGELPSPSSMGWTNVVYEMHEYQFNTPDAASVKKGADNQVTDFNNYKASDNVPCYIGKFNAFGSTTADTPTWQYVVNDFNQAGMSWSSWSYKSTHGTGSDSGGLYNPNGKWTTVPNIATDSSSTISSDWSRWTTANTFSINPMVSGVLVGGGVSITSLPQTTAAAGNPFTFQITAIGNPTSFSATNLPAGLALDSATGLISGTPTDPGDSNHTKVQTIIANLTVNSATGSCAGGLLFTIYPPGPTITSSLKQSATVGKPFSLYVLTATQLGGLKLVSSPGSQLPPGLSITASGNGLISGTPTTAGTFTAELAACNQWGVYGPSVMMTFTVVSSAPVISSAVTATATVGTAFSYTIVASNSPSSFSATGLPAGLTLNTTSGVISGKPTTSGASSIHLSAVNSAGTGILTLALTVNAPSYNSWIASFNMNGLNASPTATPLNDGVPNLLKYLFDIDPSKPMTADQRAALPTVGIDSTTVPGTEYLTLTYRQNSLVAGVTVDVQSTSDLQNWTSVVAPNLLVRTLNQYANGDSSVEVGVPVPSNIATPKFYIRLSVTGTN